MKGEKQTSLFNMKCKPVVDGTNTKSVWETRSATGNYFVKLADLAAADYSETDPEIGITFLVANDKHILGRLAGIEYIKNVMYATVELVGQQGYAYGDVSDTGNYARTDAGAWMKGTATGEIVADNANADGTETVFLIGGPKAAPLVRWNGLAVGANYA